MPRKLPDWLTQAYADAKAVSAFSGIPEEDCFRLINPDSEHDTEQVVKRYLMTQPQKQWLFDNDYSLDDVFSGRIEGDDKQAQADEFFTEWNARLGREIFG